jgi:hypothetical protein
MPANHPRHDPPSQADVQRVLRARKEKDESAMIPTSNDEETVCGAKLGRAPSFSLEGILQCRRVCSPAAHCLRFILLPDFRLSRRSPRVAS